MVPCLAERQGERQEPPRLRADREGDSQSDTNADSALGFRSHTVRSARRTVAADEIAGDGAASMIPADYEIELNCEYLTLLLLDDDEEENLVRAVSVD